MNIVVSAVSVTELTPYDINHAFRVKYMDQPAISIIWLIIISGMSSITVGIFVWLIARGVFRNPRNLYEAENSDGDITSRLDRIPLAMAVEDKDGRIIFLNRWFVDLFGYTGEEIPTQERWLQFAYPDPEYRNEVLRDWSLAIERAARTGNQIAHGDYIITARNGEHKFIQISGISIQDTTLFLFVDQTERKLLEERYHQLFNNMKSGVAVYRAVDDGKDFVFLDMNRKGRSIDNLDHITIENRKVTELFPTVQEFGLLDVFKRVWKTGIPEDMPISLYKDSRIHGWRDNYVYRLPSGEIVAIYEDVTRQKMAEEALKKSEARLRSIFDTMNEGVALNEMIFNDAGEMINYRIINVNQAFYSMADYAQSNVIGNTATNLYNMSEDMILTFWREHRERKSAHHMEMVSPTRNKHFIISVSPFFDGMFVTVFFDLTEQKRLEAKLEERVAQELEKNRRQEQLLIQQSRLAALGEMMGAIAHQWRQPLAALSAVLMNIQDEYDYGELNKDSLEDLMRDGDELLKFMSNTIDDFRNFFKPSKSKVVFDLGSKACGALNIVKSQLINNNIISIVRHQTNTSDPGTVPVDCLENEKIKFLVEGYPNEMVQVILNLINNSKDAIHQRIDERKLISGEGKIEIFLSKQDRHVLLNVCDNGGGIPESILPKLFDPYFTTKEPGKGTGIGLYMAKMIVENNMHGKITAENRGDGACFMIRLPEVA